MYPLWRYKRSRRTTSRLKQKPVERITHLEGERAFQRSNIEDRVQTTHVEAPEAHRLTFVDPEGDVDVASLAPDQRIHHRVHVPALAVQEEQTHDVPPELELVEVALFPEAGPSKEGTRREGAGIGRGDRRGERVVVDGVIALEGKPAHHPLRLLLRGERGQGGQGGQRDRDERGHERKQQVRAQLTRLGCLRMLATPLRTVNLFDT